MVASARLQKGCSWSLKHNNVKLVTMGQILSTTYQLLNLGSSDQIGSRLAQSLIRGTGHTKPLNRGQG